MKLSSENIVRSFLSSICEECWKRKGCNGCAYWKNDQCIMMASPCCWDINEIIAAREKVIKNG